VKTTFVLWSLFQPRIDDPAAWHRVLGYSSFDECEREATARNDELGRGKNIYVCQPAEWLPNKTAEGER